MVSDEFTALRPANLEANCSAEGDYFCVQLEELDSDVVHHFVQRVPNWEGASRVVCNHSPPFLLFLSSLL